MNKIIIFGHTGLLGSAVFSLLKTNNFEVIGRSYEKSGFDLTNHSEVLSFINQEEPLAVINCAAFTNVEACEDKDAYQQALAINEKVPCELANLAIKQNFQFVHISTDYVFGDNSKEGYRENYTKFNAMNSYGETKLKGELGIIKLFKGLQDSNFCLQEPNAYIIRTQWLFGRGAQNFINKIIQNAKDLDCLRVVDNEYGCPTYVKDLAQSILYLLTQLPTSGIYHAVSSNSCSRYEFAKEILKLQNIETKIEPIKLASYARKAKIYNYSILKNTKLPKMRSWQEMLKDYLTSSK